MKTYEYSWTVESVDPTNSTMLVEFVYQDHPHKLNLPIPSEVVNLDRHIRKYAPTDVWERLHDVRAQETATLILNQSGTDTAQVLEIGDIPPPPFNPNRGWLAFSDQPEVEV